VHPEVYFMQNHHATELAGHPSPDKKSKISDEKKETQNITSFQFNMNLKQSSHYKEGPPKYMKIHQGKKVSVCLFFIYSRLSNFSAIWRLSPLPVTGLQI
jgi:hypothetical protein